MTAEEKITILVERYCRNRSHLADMIGVTPQAVNNWVYRDRIPRKGIEAIMMRFPEVDLEWLRGGSVPISSGPLPLPDDEEEEEDVSDTTGALFSNSEGNLALKMYAKAEFLIFQNKDDEALRALDSVMLLSPFGTLVDDALYQKALILIKQKSYFEAEKLLKRVIENYGDQLLADDAVFKLAELYEYYLKDIPQAMEYYQKILKDYSDSLYVVQARNRYRTLRGDNVN